MNIFFIISIMVLFSATSSATVINTILIPEPHEFGLVHMNSFEPDEPGTIYGNLGLLNVDGLQVDFEIQDFPNTPSDFLLGSEGLTGNNFTIRNFSTIAWTDFHIDIIPQPNVIHFDQMSRVMSTIPSTIQVSDFSVDFIFTGQIIPPGGSFTFSDLGIIIPDGSGDEFSLILQPTFVSEPSSFVLLFIGTIFLFSCKSNVRYFGVKSLCKYLTNTFNGQPKAGRFRFVKTNITNTCIFVG